MRSKPVGYLLFGALLPYLVSAQPQWLYRVERVPVSGGGELLTIIRHGDGADDVPLISILRDTLGDDDPENDRLRYIWILTDVPPSPLQKVVSALPFAHFNPGPKHHAKGVPKPFEDLGTPGKSVWSNLLNEALRLGGVDRFGAVVRSTTRTYGGNRADHRELEVFRAMAAVEGLLDEGNIQPWLSEDDLQQIYSRLSLSGRLLGGLIRDESLPRYYEKKTSQSEQTREHNWELLRQRAELCGLYFDPIPAPNGTVQEALLWIARQDLHDQNRHEFDGQFLEISNPWTDQRLRDWTGYSKIRYFDAQNHPVTGAAPSARAMDLIPLALYSLEYPRVPLVLIDFRNSLNPKLRERSVQDASIFLGGILGVTGFTNWPLFVATSAWSFVRARHGAALRRDSRLQAYSEAQEHLAANPALDPDLKNELLGRLGQPLRGPFENAPQTGAILAREQYSILRQYAGSINGLNRKLNRDRWEEIDDHQRSAAMVSIKTAGRFFTTRPREAAEDDPTVLADLDSHRRADYHVRFLKALLRTGSLPEVSGDPKEIQECIEALMCEAEAEPKASYLIAQVFKRTQDSNLRRTCLRALASLQGQKELKLQRSSPLMADDPRAFCQTRRPGGTARDEISQNRTH